MDYVLNGENGNIFTRAAELYKRDKHAPDNEINVTDVEELKQILLRKPVATPKPQEDLGVKHNKGKKKEYNSNEGEHKKNARKSTEQKYEKGQSRK
jgi:hypothetical protein